MDWKQRLLEVNRPGETKVVVAYLHPGEVAQSFSGSLMDTLLVDQGRRIIDAHGRPAVVNSFCGAGRIADGRNQAVADFLDNRPEAGLLMFTDSDMGWDADAIGFLAEVMDDTGLPIVGGLCFAAKPLPIRPGAQRGVELNVFPTLYTWDDTENQHSPVYQYPPDTLIEVAATGGAFLMISRACLEDIREHDGDEWFTPLRFGPNWDEPGGEDISFCYRARSHGHPVHVHTGVRTSHRKHIWLTDDLYRDLQTPASSAVTVVIPVKDNLEMTRSLVGQIGAAGGFTDILLFDNGSTDPKMQAWLKDQKAATVFDASDAQGIHQLWNAGIDEAISRHHGLADIVFLNNDLGLGPRAIRRLIAGLRSQNGLMVACPNYDSRPGQGVTPLHGICAAKYDGTGGLAGFAFAMRSEWVASGYRFPEEMRWWYGDNDLVLSVEKAGGWYGMVHDSRCVHLDGGSQTERPEGWDEIVAEDRRQFEKKWPTVKLVAA